MKRTFLFSILVILAILLSACGAAGGSTNSFRTSGGSPRVLTPEAKLAIGTIKLDTTKLAVDSAEAGKLLPLWQLLNQLNASASAAPQEVTAVVNQIQSTMTPEQTSAISSMQITSADMFALFQQQGQANGSGGTRTGGTGSSNGTGRNRTGNGGGGQNFVFTGGGGAPGGGGFPGGSFGGGASRTNTGTGTPTASQGSSSAQASQTAANRSSIFLVSEVIRLLQGKIKS
jgi:hypothetical protein